MIDTEDPAVTDGEVPRDAAAEDRGGVAGHETKPVQTETTITGKPGERARYRDVVSCCFPPFPVHRSSRRLIREVLVTSGGAPEPTE
jgi:hypothetical protein